ncbi:MAG: sugar ABC transporter permease [Chthonomonas sp.]|nr:sugar ABC transporter permease [Chthonomonas sp.]
MKLGRRDAAHLRLLIPLGVGLMLLYIGPALASLLLSFTHYDGLSSPQSAGLENYAALTDDRVFLRAVANTFWFLAIALPLKLALACVLAMWLQSRKPGTGAARAAVFLPSVIPDPAMALVMLWIFNPLYGPLNLLLQQFGIAPPMWLADPKSAPWVFVLLSLFQIGELFVVLMVARMEIAGELYENAKLAGAARWAQFWHVTLPQLAPWMFILGARDMMMSLQSTFTFSHMMTQGDPYYSTMFIGLIIYEEAFDRFRFGLGSAMMVVAFLLCLAVLGLVRTGLRRWRYHVDL